MEAPYENHLSVEPLVTVVGVQNNMLVAWWAAQACIKHLSGQQAVRWGGVSSGDGEIRTNGRVGALRETGGRGKGNEKQRRVSFFCLNAFCEEGTALC